MLKLYGAIAGLLIAMIEESEPDGVDVPAEVAATIDMSAVAKVTATCKDAIQVPDCDHFLYVSLEVPECDQFLYFSLEVPECDQFLYVSLEVPDCDRFLYFLLEVPDCDQFLYFSLEKVPDCDRFLYFLLEVPDCDQFLYFSLEVPDCYYFYCSPMLDCNHSRIGSILNPLSARGV